MSCKEVWFWPERLNEIEEDEKDEEYEEEVEELGVIMSLLFLYPSDPWLIYYCHSIPIDFILFRVQRNLSYLQSISEKLINIVFGVAHHIQV